MTIPSQLQSEYNRVRPTLDRLKSKCDLLLSGVATSAGGWSYSRVKPIESLLLKIEKDGNKKPFSEINDLFGATIVVNNSLLFSNVESGLTNMFDIVDRLTPKTKRPYEFMYDDYHLIVKLKEQPGRDELELSNIKFELQLKTSMQDAASTVARELEYKPKRLSWLRGRIASRIRALVEMVDDLLDRLASQEELHEPQYEVFQRRNQIIEVLETTLNAQQLPTDKRRLAVIVEQYLNLCKPEVTVEQFKQMLEKDEYREIREAASLTAAGSAFLVLFMEEKLVRSKEDPASLRGKCRFLITNEMVEFCPVLRNVPKARSVLLS
jgi:ppGpp synthetase/RelA/SpoT-type nucleotidyltranferase